MKRIRKKMTAVIIIISLFCFCIQNLAAESINGKTVGFIAGNSDAITFNLEDIVVINAVSIPDHQEGMELEIDIPGSLQDYQNSFALMIYKSVTPEPGMDVKSYNGIRVYMRLLTTRESMYLRIPFNTHHTVSGDALTQLLPVAVTPDDFPLLFTILPVVKGIPDMVYSQNFTIQASPLWRNEGLVSVSITNLSGSPEETILITIDGNEVSQNEKIALETGIHKIIVSSTHAPLVEKTVVVEPGEEIDIPVTLDYRPPELTIKTLDGAQIFLDGNEILSDDNGIEVDNSILTLEVEPGDHIITSILGDYELSRSFTIRPGGRVRIELLFEIKIAEYENESGNPYGLGN